MFLLYTENLLSQHFNYNCSIYVLNITTQFIFKANIQSSVTTYFL